MKKALVLFLLAAGCATPGVRPPPSAPIPDTALGLARGSVFDTLVPPAVKEEESTPGEKPVLPRAFPGAPPMVPHGIQGFLPITRAENACLACHGEAKAKKAGEPTPLPPSHYTDFTRRPPAAGKEMSGARWVCTSCHVQQTDAKPIVGNRFRP